MANPNRYDWRHPITVKRFLARCFVEDGSECVFFDGAPNGRGSDWIRLTAWGFPEAEAGKVYVHRYAYAVMRGPIPPGHDLDHACRVKECVNPYHLEPISKSEHGALSGADKWGDADENWEEPVY